MQSVRHTHGNGSAGLLREGVDGRQQCGSFLRASKKANRYPFRDVREISGDELCVEVRIDEKHIGPGGLDHLSQLVEVLEDLPLRDYHTAATQFRAEVRLCLLQDELESGESLVAEKT